MTVRRLDANGDIVTSGVQFITGKEEILQTIRTRLQLFLGEYFRNKNEGTDWFGKVYGKDFPPGQAEAEIKRRIFQTPGVFRVINLTTDIDVATRSLTFSCQVITQEGAITISEKV